MTCPQVIHIQHTLHTQVITLYIGRDVGDYPRQMKCLSRGCCQASTGLGGGLAGDSS